MSSTRCCFKGRGAISLVNFAALAAKTDSFRPVGNAPVLTVNVSEKVDNVMDFVGVAGGIECQSREIEMVEGDLQLICHSLENLKLAAFGAGAEDNVAQAAVVSEPYVAWPGKVMPLVDLPDPTVAILVRNQAGTTTYVAGVDYELTGSGAAIRVLPGSSIPAPTITGGVGQPNVYVSYTRKLQSKVQLYNKITDPMALLFDGYNVAGDTTEPVRHQLYKVRLGPAQNQQLISEGIVRLDFKFTALKDTSRPAGTLANPLSQYGTLQI
jgi:hypothetical protein